MIRILPNFSREQLIVNLNFTAWRIPEPH